jgi:hypothetical protein
MKMMNKREGNILAVIKTTKVILEVKKHLGRVIYKTTVYFYDQTGDPFEEFRFIYLLVEAGEPYPASIF